MKKLFTSNHLYYIESLKDSEIDKYDNHLYESCIKLLTIDNIIKSSFHRIYCKKDLDELFLKIYFESLYNGIHPILHIDTHGDTLNGLKLANDDYYGWELLVEKLRNININCKNNLFITFSVCYSYKIFINAKLNNPCPFYSTIVTNSEIMLSELRIRYHNFYNQFLLDGNIEKSLFLLNKEYPQINNSLFYFQCEDIFDKTFNRYFNKLQNKEVFIENFYNILSIYEKENNTKFSRREKRRKMKFERKIFPDRFKSIRYKLKQIFIHSKT